MISADAKCVVNGPKVNEVIDALNPLLNMSIAVGDVSYPQINSGESGVQILIPDALSFANEELDVVDSSNSPSTRWFITNTSAGQLSGGSAAIGAPSLNSSSPSPKEKNRDELSIEGGTTNNRDKLNTSTTQGTLTTSRPIAPKGDLLDDGLTAKQAGANFRANKQRAAGVDEFGNTIGGSGRGDLADDGLTAKQAGANFLAAKKAWTEKRAARDMPAQRPVAPLRSGNTTPPPLPGAPPPNLREKANAIRKRKKATSGRKGTTSGTTSGKFGPNYRSTDDMAGRRSAERMHQRNAANSTANFVEEANRARRQKARELERRQWD